MNRKEVEDVRGGKDAWANVDKTDGMCPLREMMRCGKTEVGGICARVLADLVECDSSMPSGRMRWGASFLLPGADSECG